MHIHPNLKFTGFYNIFKGYKDKGIFHKQSMKVVQSDVMD